MGASIIHRTQGDQMSIGSSNHGQHVVEVALTVYAPSQISEPIIDADYVETIQSID
jgi:hypothetical protein